MAQISRPFQVALVAVLLFAGVWFFALQGHSSSPSSPSGPSTASTSAPSTAAASATAGSATRTPTSSSSSSKSTPAKSAPPKSQPGRTASSTHVYHGPAPGLEGLSRAIVHAHEAVAAAGAAPQSAQSSKSSTGTSSAHSKPAPASKATTHASAPAASATPKLTPAHHSAAEAVSLSGQLAVEAQLAKGDVVLVLFWSSQGTDDQTTHKAVQQVRQAAQRSHARLAVREASAKEVAKYGSVTRGVQVYSTPTLLVLNAHAQAIVLTGVQDVFSIDQAIEEARHPQSQPTS